MYLKYVFCILNFKHISGRIFCICISNTFQTHFNVFVHNLSENRADGDISISSPCRYELSDSSSDSYSCAKNSGPES